MKVREIMTREPVCCTAEDTAQKVARTMRDQNVGSLPVVLDQQSRTLLGMITDRDLCCTILADGLDPRTTKIEKMISLSPVSCRDGENLDECERLMQSHQLRRIPVVDSEGHCIGIVAQADLALREKPEKVSRIVAEISRPKETPGIAA
jgi:CBS domain-containing protein